MARWRGNATAAQHHLIGHELAIVLADGTFGLAIAGIGDIRAGGPFPNLTHTADGMGTDLPLLFARQSPTGPFGEGRRFVGADVAYGLCLIERLRAGQGEDLPAAAILVPV